MSKTIQPVKPWCLNHEVKLVKGYCPYETLADFMGAIEEWEAGVEGSPTEEDLISLDAIYRNTLSGLGL